jgi:photosystem II stability/assembly factor-like uncharacterized protein
MEVHMGRKTFSIVIALLCTLALPGRAEKLVPEPPFGSLEQYYKHLYFTSQGLGYVLSERALLRTTDFGGTWVVLLDRQQDRIGGFRQVFFVDADTLYVHTAADAFLRTTDRGNTFRAATSEVPTIDEPQKKVPVGWGFFFLDALRGWSLARDLFVITKDGGETWGRVPVSLSQLNEPTRLWFFDVHRGIGVGGRQVVRTTDGGLNWDPVAASPWVDDVRCIASGFCASPGPDVATVYVTNDAGETWRRVETGLDPERDKLHDFQVIGVGDVVLVGSHNDVRPSELREKRGGTTYVRRGPPDRGLLLRWTGGTWQRREYPEVETFWAIYYVDQNEVWASADGNGILHSTDGAQTWTFVPDYYRQIAALTPSRTPFVFPTPSPPSP